MLQTDTVEGFAFARPDSLNIQLLGGCRLFGDGHFSEPSSWRLRKPAHLVKLLALAPEHQLHREQLFEYLWPHLSPAAGGNNLRVALHFAREFLNQAGFRGASVLQILDARVTLLPGQPVWSDVEAFEAAARAANGRSDPALFEAALALYTGELLPEDRFEDWAAERRESLRGACFDLLKQVSRLYERRGDLNQAAGALRSLLDLEPAHEPAHVALMRWYAQGGERVRALRQYQTLREALLRELDVEPEPETTSLYEALLAGNLDAAESFDGGLTMAPVTSHRAAERAPRGVMASANLPLSLTSFVGREHELRELFNALEHSRLVTLTGPAGTGKTRLALEAASRCEGVYPDGIWFVDLAALLDASLVIPAIASTLGIQEAPGRRLIETLTESLAQRRLLLLLDNCEHLIDTCADVISSLLRSCSEVRLLVTSREPLRVDGEAVWPAPPLGVPDPQQDNKFFDVRHIEAVTLFSERAHSASHGFVLTQTNAAAVASICRRLDGMPLAIELAATRVRALSIEQIAERLDDSLSLLSAGGRDRSDRQQSLRAAIAWSYDLLADDEQLLLRRLAVFAGGFTIEGVDAVCSSEDMPAERVLDLLFQLIEKSLIVVEDRDNDARYRLLETIRQYAWEQLEQVGEVEQIRDRHLAYYLAIALEAKSESRGANRPAWLFLLKQEHNNLRVALGWASETENAVQGLELATALVHFWYAHGNLTEGRRWLDVMLAIPGIASATHTRLNAVFGLGRILLAQGDYLSAYERFEAALSLARELEDPDYIAGCFTQLGHISRRKGEYRIARELYTQSLTIRRQLGDVWYVAVALDGLGQVALAEQDYAVARERLAESLGLFREVGDIVEVAHVQHSLGRAALQQGDLVFARRILNESLAVRRETGDQLGSAAVLADIGHLLSQHGQRDEARVALTDSLRLFHELGANHRLAYCLDGLATVIVAHQPELSLSLAGAAESLRETSGEAQTRELRARSEEAIVLAEKALGKPAVAAAWEAGRSMTLDQAVASALGQSVN